MVTSAEIAIAFRPVCLISVATAEVKQERFDRMLAMQQEISREIWAADVGTELEVLVEGESRMGEGQIFGRTTWNRIVNFNGPSELSGHVVPVTITKSYRNSQLGELPEDSGREIS